MHIARRLHYTHSAHTHTRMNRNVPPATVACHRVEMEMIELVPVAPK